MYGSQEVACEPLITMTRRDDCLRYTYAAGAKQRYREHDAPNVTTVSTSDHVMQQL